MNEVQRNAGTAGYIAALLLVLLLILFLSLGIDPANADGAALLALVAAKKSLWTLTGVVGAVVIGFSIVFVVGLADRLRERAPTRGAAVLYLTVTGLAAGYGLSALTRWLGGNYLTTVAAKDATAAAHAMTGLWAITRGMEGFAGAFLGAGLLLGAWAILETGVFRPVAGWLAALYGLALIVGLFVPSPALFLASFILPIIWIAWVSYELRSAHPVMQTART